MNRKTSSLGPLVINANRHNDPTRFTLLRHKLAESNQVEDQPNELVLQRLSFIIMAIFGILAGLVGLIHLVTN